LRAEVQDDRAESLPIEYSMTGRSNSAATSRMMWIALVFQPLQCVNVLMSFSGKRKKRMANETVRQVDGTSPCAKGTRF
jgi:hypothetical protein